MHCVKKKRRNSWSRWVSNNKLTRCTDGSNQLETRCRSESQRQTEGFGPSGIHGWATPAKMRKKCCYGRKKNWGQNGSLSLSPVYLLHTTNITLSRIKCERYIFIKKCVRSFIEVGHDVWLCSACIWICMWPYNISHAISFTIGLIPLLTELTYSSPSLWVQLYHCFSLKR